MTKLTLTDAELKFHKKCMKHLRNYRKTRNELIESTTKDEWKSWANTIHFWLNYSVSNLTFDETKYCVDFVLKYDKNHKFSDLQDILLSTYNDPDQWLNEKYSLQNMIKEHGFPIEEINE